MTNEARLLDQLANITSIRDIELLEFSLLKTIHGFFRPKSLSLVKLDRRNRPRMEIVFGEGGYSVLHEQIVLSETVTTAINYLTSSKTRESEQIDGGDYTTVYNLIETRATITFLRITTAEKLNRMDNHMVAGMLQVYRNFCDLLQYAQTDLLTGLANRKTFDEYIMKIFELIPPEADDFQPDRRTDKPLRYWLAMIDIDHFKTINDRFGHLYGDEVLVLLAQMMRTVFRDDDMVFRFGGEEFVVILRCPDKEGCKTALERMRKAIDERDFPQIGNVTISVGAAEIERHVFAMTLIDHADQALYFSKHNGRNQVTFYNDLIEMGITTEKKIEPGDITLF